jgi:cytochrome c-type biogenesis protein CcmH
LTTFILAGALMVSIALGLLAWPLWQGRAREGRGTLIALGVVVIALPLGAVGIYRGVSTWDWDPAVSQAPAGQHALDEMVTKLEERLKQNPGDVDGWLLLARSHYVTQRFANAADAYGKAYELSGGKNLEAVVGYGEALALVDQNSLRGKSGQLFEEALKLDPQNQKALFYGGVAAAATDRLPVARERWMTLLRQELPPEVKTLLVERIGDVDRQLGRPADPEIAKLAQAAAPAAAVVAASTPASAPAGAPAAGPPPGPGIVTVRVRVSPALAAKIPAGAPLFVLARDPTQPGPPFGAKRFAGSALPMQVQLTEQDSMMPARTIKTAKQLVIVARFSASGMPNSSSGDLYGEVPYDVSKGQAVDLVIDKQVP